MCIRHFKATDYPMVANWWREQGEIAPLLAMMPESSSFVLELDGQPALAVTLYLTNSPEVCYVENFVGNPSIKSQARYEASSILLNHITEFARNHGFKRLMCLAHKPQLVKRYTDLGFTATLDGVTTFTKETELSCPQQH